MDNHARPARLARIRPLIGLGFLGRQAKTMAAPSVCLPTSDDPRWGVHRMNLIQRDRRVVHPFPPSVRRLMSPVARKRRLR